MHRWGWTEVTKNRCGPTCNQSTSPTAGAKTWSTTSVVNHDLGLDNDPSVPVPGFSLPRAQWCALNRFRTGQGRCAFCLKKWGLSSSEFCACGDTEMMSHIVESESPVPLTNWTVASSVFTVLMKLLFSGWTHISRDACVNNSSPKRHHVLTFFVGITLSRSSPIEFYPKVRSWPKRAIYSILSI